MIEFTHNDWMDVEDSLQLAGVFINGMRHTPAHRDSYMTIVDFKALDAWWAEHAGKTFKVDLLLSCVEYWKRNSNVQPPSRIVAAMFEHYIKANGNQ